MRPASTGAPLLAASRWAWRVATLLAAAALFGGLYGAFTYVNDYSQHRGFAVLHRAPGIRAGHSVWMHFYSPALHREADYLVYLPTGYTPHHRYPVYYLLHGLPGRPQAFIRIASMDVLLDNLVGEHKIGPMILVFPDGRINGNTLSDSEWANTPSGNFDSYVIDVVRNVDRRLATIPSARARVIAGYSAGAYGAINIALHHLGVFGSVQIWSGYFTQTRSGVFAHASAAELAYNSPIKLLPKLSAPLHRDPLHVFIYCGRGDDNHVLVAPMAAALRRAGAIVRAAIYGGGHDWGLWHGHMAQMIELAARETGAVAPRARPRRAHRRHRARSRRHHRRRGRRSRGRRR